MSEVAFIHTADVNLRESQEDSFPFLRWLVDKCVEHRAAMLISGDLFESADEASRMHKRVRDFFQEAPDVPKFILAGNRDAEALEEIEDLGPAIHRISRAPFEAFEHAGVHIAGFPFVPGSSLRDQLDDYSTPGRPLIALLHGTYFGKGTHRYFEDVRDRNEDFFPIYASDIEDIGACYAGIGHYHKHHSSFIYNDIVVCYPGTPIALSPAETGIRTVVLVRVDTESGDVDIERIPVPVGVYYSKQELEIFACYEEDALSGLERMLETNADKRANLTVRLKGNIHLLERNMNERLALMRSRFSSEYENLTLRNETVSFRSLIDERPLVRDFMARLAANEKLDEVTRARALELGLRAFDRVKGYTR